MGNQRDNPQKVLALWENDSLDHVHWSPDGQRLAYIRIQRTPETYSIETCDLKGANRTVVVPASDCGRKIFAGFGTGGSSTRGRILRIQVTTTFGRSALIVSRARPPANRNASRSGRDLTLGA